MTDRFFSNPKLLKHFVYRSKFPVLIDTGYVSGFDETERRISELGVTLSDISLIINTHWFKETINLYFSSDYELKYNEIMSLFIQKGIVIRKNRLLSTTVKP